MQTKLIGVTTRVTENGDGRKQFINEKYLSPLIKNGFNVIILTLNNPNFEEVLNLCHGFVIAGGSDINPVYYNQINSGESKGCDDSIDRLDQAVIIHAVK